MNETGFNNISKKDALVWWSGNRRQYQSGLADLIYRVTVCGEEYSKNDRDPYMSYICRVFNITAYEANKQQNRIKGRYRKYYEYDDIQRVIEDIIRKHPDGFTSEFPRFDDLLKDHYASKIYKEPVVEENNFSLRNESYDLGRQGEKNCGTGSKGLDGIGTILCMIGVAIFIIFLVRGCGGCIGDKASGIMDFISNKYKFEAFAYDNMMYAGNKRGNKPDGVCAGIPMRSIGTTYTLGDYDGSEIEGYGIICASDIPLQSNAAENQYASDYDEAEVRIRMGEMKESVLNGYGAVFNSSKDTIVLGEYKKGKLKKYGCKVYLDENGNISFVEAVKKDKVKRQLEDGTYKGMTYYPEEGKIVINKFEYTIDAGKITLSTEGVNMSVHERHWTFDLFNADTEEGIYMEYALGENVKCEVITNDSKGVRVDASEMPIKYGNDE